MAHATQLAGALSRVLKRVVKTFSESIRDECAAESAEFFVLWVNRLPC